MHHYRFINCSVDDINLAGVIEISAVCRRLYISLRVIFYRFVGFSFSDVSSIFVVFFSFCSSFLLVVDSYGNE